MAVCRAAISQAKADGRDVVILDTAGRLHIDDDLMGELRDINSQLKPHQIYLVLDSMSGQDAVNSAKAFNEQLELDGLILTKLDSDTRGGALLSAKMITGKPVKFLGVGEKLDRLEEFRPEGMASPHPGHGRHRRAGDRGAGEVRRRGDRQAPGEDGKGRVHARRLHVADGPDQQARARWARSWG